MKNLDRAKGELCAINRAVRAVSAGGDPLVVLHKLKMQAMRKVKAAKA